MRWIILTAILATGCLNDRGDNGGQFGEETGAHCEITDETPLGLTDVSSLGFSAQDVLDLAAGTHTDTLTWRADSTTTQLDLTVTHGTGAVVYVEQAMVDDSDDGGIEPAIAMDCPAYLAIDVDMGFATADGVFDESWSLALQAVSADEVSWTVSLDTTTGTFDVWDHTDPSTDYDDARAWVDGRFDSAGSHGEVVGQGEGTDGDPNDPDSTAWAENLQIGFWDVADEQ